MSYAALSRYNAEKLLQEQPEKLIQIEKKLFNAMELNSRNDRNKLQLEQPLFDAIDKIYSEFSYLHAIPNPRELQILQEEIFNISCFVNGREIVDTYGNMTSTGVAHLKSLNILNYDRSLYITNFLQFLNEMNIQSKNFILLVDLQMQDSSQKQVDSLSREVYTISRRS